MATCVAAVFGCSPRAVQRRPEPTAQSVIRDFYACEKAGRAEDQLMDPLILNRDLVAPAVVEAVKDPSMKLRRYAIGFLGNERVTEAIPALEDIVANGHEVDYVRSDALESVYLIDKRRGLVLARRYLQDRSMLGDAARDLVSGRFVEHRRTYEQAARGAHEE